MESRLSPIDTHLLHKEVQKRLKTYIIENKLKNGDRLPTEKQIAQQMQVSRNVVREALKGLEALGLIEVRKGAGTFVAAFSAKKYLQHYTYSMIVEGINIDELWKVRKALELTFIDQVTASINQEDLQDLDELVTILEKAAAKNQSTLAHELRIHQRIYRCLGNRILEAIVDSYVELLSRLCEPLSLNPSWSAQIHRQLVESLRRRDAEAARAALIEDLGIIPPSAHLTDQTP